jgi:hypothetical protein
METMVDMREGVDKVIKGLFWTTRSGNQLHVSEMDTDHVFNSLRLLYNNLAMGCGLETIGVRVEHKVPLPTRSTNRSRGKAVRKVMAFMVVIERRGDLPMEYDALYYNISNSLKNPMVIMRMIDGREK